MLLGSLSRWKYFPIQCEPFEPRAQMQRPLKGRGLWTNFYIGEPDMPKAVRIATPIAASTSSEKSYSNTFVSVALFSGIGLLVSLVAVLLGVSGVWY
jgi:hypothetical protein